MPPPHTEPIMNTETFLHRVLKPVHEHIEALIKTGNITADESRAHDLSFTLLAAVQKHLKDYKEPESALSIIGALYSTAATCEYLGGITRQALNDRINKHTILRLKDGAGRNGYPIFQFSNGTVDPYILQIVQTLLDGHFSEWQTALWITTPSLMYNGASPLEYLRTSPKNFGQVLAHAENDVNNLYANS